MDNNAYPLAYEEYRKGNFDKALMVLKDLMASQPAFFRAHVLAALCCLKLKRFREGVELCKKAIEISPDYHKTYPVMAECLRGLNRIDDAIEVLEKAIKIQPLAEYYFNLGICYMDMNRADEAAVVFKKAVEMNPGDAEYVSDYANACFNAGKVKEAVAALEEYNKKNPAHRREIEFKTRIKFALKNVLSKATTPVHRPEQTTILLDPYNPEEK